jgi:cytochrome b pre-mRNA-processing protein 3
MMGKLLRSRGNRQVIAALHSGIVAAARRPELFLPPYEAPDTLEGRFDLLVLFSILVALRLESLPEPGPEVAQELVNALFEHFEADLREMGVGDLSLPKRMKTLAEAFSGRSAAYRGALARNQPLLASALARNIYGSETADARADALAAYCHRAVVELERAELANILAGPPFPHPETRHAKRC